MLKQIHVMIIITIIIFVMLTINNYHKHLIFYRLLFIKTSENELHDLFLCGNTLVYFIL